MLRYLSSSRFAGCFAFLVCAIALAAPKTKPPVPAAPPPAPMVAAAVPTQEDLSKTVVDVAVASKDHTTLVTALKAADYVRSLQNAGPFTVFAPTNDAFAKLPKGTVEGLLVPDKVEALQNILKYHVAVSVYDVKAMRDGMKLGQANGQNVVFHIKDGRAYVNDALIVASIRAGNGIIHVVDTVLLPPAK